jgi:non-ribosomal peptide synthetase-like protein
LKSKIDPDNSIRWREGERLDHLFEQRCDQLEKEGCLHHPAVIAGGSTHTYRELDDRANQLARYLRSQGIDSGDRIALLLDKSFKTYVALLAVLKVNATYVPLDASFPKERISYILEDAGVNAVLSLSVYRDKLQHLSLPCLYIDQACSDIAAQSTTRLDVMEKAPAHDQLAYIIYTSGTTGNPKGVAIEHPSICNFVKVAAETYDYSPDDRVYQGMTIAFDFSVEELWVSLIAGSALVPGKSGINLVGQELHEYLHSNRVTVLCCVPTLLATIVDDLPYLRILLVSGEACPPDLVVRWHRQGRTILNAYGPTEATVTATITELLPDKLVTIGGPLPTYTIVILDEHEDKIVDTGQSGEIGIAGIGLAKEYLNREDLTREKFIEDFLNIENNPSKRIYRTGDLGRITAYNEIEYQGRIDTQVKIRGYRIELTEIETIILQTPQVAQAVVDTYQTDAGMIELVAYYSLKSDAEDLDHDELVETLRNQLPGYMIPSYFERLAVIPMTNSHKADRKNLPAPIGPRYVGSAQTYVSPKTPIEKEIAATLAGVLQVDQVSVRDDFFNDLGAHSLLMVLFCADLRSRRHGADISIRDVYQNPTVEELARHLELADQMQSRESIALPRHVPTSWQFYGCGLLQMATYYGLGLIGLWLLLTGFHWTYAVIANHVALYLRIVSFFAATLFGLSATSIAMKWLLIGRWKEELIPIWSLRYFRFWLARLFVQNSPMSLFRGGPLYNVYLRLLGAKIGKNAVIGSSAPLATDLLSVGDDTLIRNGTMLPGYHAKGNYIYTGSVDIGKNAFVGSASMIDIDTVIGNNAQLGHSSTLQQGQRIPDGRTYHGTPAEETKTNYCTVEPRHCSALRRWLYTGGLFLLYLAIAPLPVFILYHAFPHLYQFCEADKLNYDSLLSVLYHLIPVGVALSQTIFLTLGLLALLLIRYLPRLINLFIKEDRTYVLFGVHFFLQRMVSAISNSGSFNALLGDSSIIVYYLKWIGMKLKKIVQTGANFGLDQIHDNPFSCEIGTGTMVSDGLAMANVEMTSSSFRIGKVKIGEHNYLGNNVFYPTNGKTGANVLIGTKTMVPVDGEIRENTGLLGSPCFEIPRTVHRDTSMIGQIDDETRKRLLRHKDRYNLATMLACLLKNWMLSFITVLLLFVAVLYYPIHGAWSIFTWGVFIFPFYLFYWISWERLSLGLRKLKASFVNMYDDYFLYHERHWKFCVHPLSNMFRGTPYKNLISRLLGVKMGRRVFDDGANIYDKTLIEIGDVANLNTACVLQGHSLEEGVFKSDYVKVGSGASIGCAAFVHYGVKVGDEVILEPNAFLMKGEVVPQRSIWRGNPARAVSSYTRLKEYEDEKAG